jgi:phosphoenolpyruvate carboxykinase (ATP)
MEILIGGTFYAGEIKKSIFTVMNDRLPLEGVLPMHCSANVGDDGRVARLLRPLGHRQDDALGRPERRLIGDDEHGWGDAGVFNFEGGCYAKVIRLSAEAEPEIFRTTHTLRDESSRTSSSTERGVVDLDDDSKTRTPGRLQARADSTTRPPDQAGRPPVVGDLPHRGRVRDPAADARRLSRDQALFYFLSGSRPSWRHRDRRHRAAADVLRAASARRSCRSTRPSTPRYARREARPCTAAPVWLVNTAGRAGASARARACRSAPRGRC